MTRRSTDWHSVAKICLGFVLFPVALLIQLLPLKRTRDREPSEVAQYISKFLNGTAGEWEWDDFTSVPITNPALEMIRAEAEMVQLPLGSAGRITLENLLKRAKALDRADIALQESLFRTMRSRNASAETVVIGAELIASEARVSIRFAKLKGSEEGRRISEDDLMKLLERMDELYSNGRAACEEFAVDGNREKLHHTLTLIRDQFESLFR
jgi:hypothetical protein